LKIEVDENFSIDCHGYNVCTCCCYGKISIQDIDEPDFYEHFYMNLDTWSMDDYKKQWELAFKRLETRKKSCFVVNFEVNRLVMLWPLYRVGRIIYIQNHMYIDEAYKKNIGDCLFTPETSLKFVHDRDRIRAEAKKMSEWQVKII